MPLLESELKKVTNCEDFDANNKDKEKEDVPSKPVVERSQGSRLVTSDGTYATQSAFSMQQPSTKV
jgi:hypothetical protein